MTTVIVKSNGKSIVVDHSISSFGVCIGVREGLKNDGKREKLHFKHNFRPFNRTHTVQALHTAERCEKSNYKCCKYSSLPEVTFPLHPTTSVKCVTLIGNKNIFEFNASPFTTATIAPYTNVCKIDVDGRGNRVHVYKNPQISDPRNLIVTFNELASLTVHGSYDSLKIVVTNKYARVLFYPQACTLANSVVTVCSEEEDVVDVIDYGKQSSISIHWEPICTTTTVDIQPQQISSKDEAIETIEYDEGSVIQPCCFCLNKLPDRLLQPCGHMLCGGCGQSLLLNQKNCPHIGCNRKITRLRRAILPINYPAAKRRRSAASVSTTAASAIDIVELN